jgi:hypothetical protein
MIFDYSVAALVAARLLVYLIFARCGPSDLVAPKSQSYSHANTVVPHPLDRNAG